MIFSETLIVIIPLQPEWSIWGQTSVVELKFKLNWEAEFEHIYLPQVTSSVWHTVR